jgi:hypothetical protein
MTMRTYHLILLLWSLMIATSAISQVEYSNALFSLDSMLSGKKQPIFKDAVYLTENCYSEIDRGYFNDNIQALLLLTKLNKQNYSIIYKGKDSVTVNSYAALFKTMTDTTVVLLPNDTNKYQLLPFRYNFNDIFGSKDWSNMFVSRLIDTRQGNCHSLPYLYKILANEIGVKAYLALAPNHVYIKHRAEKGGWYNTELTSASFPMDAWLMASGYISLQAVQNGIYLDTLSEKESIVLCVLDLAQGYNHKYPDNDGNFVIECCDLALKHFPDYVNAILLKAETRLKQLQAMQKEMKYAYLKEVTALPEGMAKWDEMNSLYMQLYKLGYRQMPEQMYVEWLTSLKTEKEKYSNKNAPGATKD